MDGLIEFPGAGFPGSGFPGSGRRRAAFLDRDGVLIENLDNYVLSRDDIRLIPGAASAVHKLRQAGYGIVVVSNQAAVGRGLVSAEEIRSVHAEVQRRCAALSADFSASYLCPHHPDSGCPCRKPRPGMLLRAADQLGIDLSRSVMFGDAVTDLQAGERAGVPAHLVLTGRGRDQLRRAPGLTPDRIHVDLGAAVDRVLDAADVPATGL